MITRYKYVRTIDMNLEKLGIGGTFSDKIIAKNSSNDEEKILVFNSSSDVAIFFRTENCQVLQHKDGSLYVTNIGGAIRRYWWHDMEFYIHDKLKVKQSTYGYYVDTRFGRCYVNSLIKNTRFVEFVDILDKVKEMWYLLRFLETFPNGCKDSVFEDVYSELTSENLASVKDCQKMLAEGLNNQVTNILAGKRGYVIAELEALLKNVKANLWTVGDEGTPVVTDAILDAGESGDTKFYTQLGVGKYWNEVELPAEIGSLFDTFACSIENVGIVPSGKELEDGMAAISYYDISDAIIVFESMDAAKAFAEANPIEPSDFLVLHDNAWYSSFVNKEDRLTNLDELVIEV